MDFLTNNEIETLRTLLFSKVENKQPMDGQNYGLNVAHVHTNSISLRLYWLGNPLMDHKPLMTKTDLDQYFFRQYISKESFNHSKND